MYKGTILALFLLLATFSPLYIVSPSMAQGIAVLSVEPPVLTGLEIGQEFMVNLTVTNVADLCGWQFVLYYTSSVLNATSLVPSSTWSSPNAFFTVANFTDNYNATHGQIFAASALLGAAGGITGTTLLATVSFKTLAYGNSPLYVDPYGQPPDYTDRTKLIDSTKPFGKEISFEVHQGRAHVGLVDISIIKVAAPLNIPKGGLALINVTVENQGRVTQTFDVTLRYNATAIATQTVTNLTPTENRTLTFPWDTTPIPIGEYALTANATLIPGETDLEDNNYNAGIIYMGKRDVAITNTHPSKIYTNDTLVYINVSATNNGEATQKIDITAYVDADPIDTKTGITLPPGAVTHVIFLLDTTPLPKGVYAISAKAHPVPGETNTADNTYTDGTITETIRGDVTGDFKIDILDIAAIAKAFASYPGHPKWNPNADLDNSNDINILDIAIAAKNFGKEI